MPGATRIGGVMPELPEIEVLRRSLEPRLLGRRIERIEARRVALREPLDGRALRRALSGARIVAVRRRAKYLLLDVESGSTLLVHLGMSGRLTLAAADAPREPHEHLSLHLDGGERLRLRDPRRFGLAVAIATAGLSEDPHLATLGVEPLSPEFGAELLCAAAARRRGPVKNFLMDGRVVVGVGNIYASEALFRARIAPQRGVDRLRSAQWARVADAVVETLAQAIAEGGTTLNDFTDGAGSPGLFQVSLAVYARGGEPCPRCAARIRRLVQAGRSSFYCPRCQR